MLQIKHKASLTEAQIHTFSPLGGNFDHNPNTDLS